MNDYRLVVALLLSTTLNSKAQVRFDSLLLNNVEDAWNLAKKNDSNRKIHQLTIEKAIRDYKVSLSYLLPTISGGFTGQDSWTLPVTPVPGELTGKPGTTFNAQFGKQFTYNAGITISKSLFDWQASLANKLAKNNIALKNAEAEAYDQLLKQQIGQYYYAALIGSFGLLITKKDLEKADSITQLAQQRLSEGLIDALTRNQAIINYNNVTTSYYQSVQLFEQSLSALSLLMGLLPETKIIFKEKIVSDTLSSLATMTLAEDKNIYPFELQIHNAELSEKIALAAFVPRLSIYSYLGKQQFRSDFGISFNDGNWNNYNYIGINLTAPLFSGFGNKNKLKSTQLSSKVVQEQYKNAQLQSALNDKTLLANLSCSIAIATSARNNFNLYQHNLSLSNQKYTEGIISMDGYLKSHEDYLKAENNYLNSIATVFSYYAILLSRK